MASKQKWPAGIRPSPNGKGIRIKIWRSGKLAYSETVPGSVYNRTDLAAAIGRRDQLNARKNLGLSLNQSDRAPEAFGDVAQRWLGSLQIDQDTIRGYMGMLNKYWMPAYAPRPLEEITQADILERLAATGVSIKTQKNIVGPLRMVLAHGGAAPNPASNINWPKRQARKKTIERYRPGERDTIVTTLARLSRKAAALAQSKPSQENLSAAHWADQASVYFPLLFATGLRPGEALGLLWRDYSGQYLTVSKQYTRGKAKPMTKTGVDRRVYVPEWVRPILDSHSSRFAKGAIFLGYKGEALRNTKKLNPVWELAHTEARVPLRIPYTCRHTRAAELLSRGVGPAEAAAELGHSPQMFLNTYSEWIKEYAGERDMSRFESTPTDQKPTKANADNEK